MRTVIIALITSLSIASCGGNAARTRRTAPALVEPKRYGYTVQSVHPHPTTSYTQGLQFADGMLWEGTGQHGQSVLQRLDLETGAAQTVARLPRSEFGEGIALLDGKIYQLTWQSNRAHVYDAASGRKTGEFTYPGEGWGLTTDGQKLYMSDGSEKIYTIDPETFRREKSITVTVAGQPVHLLNELEWIGGKIWANVYTTDQLVIIDPATGTVEGIVDLTGLLPDADRTSETDVLNGIAYDASADRIFVTGKNWPKLFEITIFEL